MRISDWSSDVCSSDLIGEDAHVLGHIGDSALGDVGRRQRGDVAAVEPHVALRGLPQAHDGAQGRGLAGTVATQQHGELATRHGEIDAMQDMVTADMGMHALERSEEHTSELQSLMRISYAVFCLTKKKN